MVSQAQRSESTRSAILDAARRLFARGGFEATSIDDIAAACGVAKGAVYHHYRNKGELFERVLEALQAELANTQPQVRAGADPLQLIVAAVEGYLTAASQPGARQILLVDGPAVVGWQRWREIDFRYFGAGARLAVQHLLGVDSRAANVDAVTHLLMGAVTEAALVCATASNPARQARVLARALGSMLSGLRGLD